MRDPTQMYAVMSDVVDELLRATKKYNSFHSAHEGYGVILEELDELWDDIKFNNGTVEMRKEAIQVAAMAVRFILDLCSSDRKGTL